MLEYYSAPLLKASQLGFELYPTVLLCAFIKVLPPLVRKFVGVFGARAWLESKKKKEWRRGAAARPFKIFTQSYASELDFATHTHEVYSRSMELHK
jgi:hypothetical protein